MCTTITLNYSFRSSVYVTKMVKLSAWGNKMHFLNPNKTAGD